MDTLGKVYIILNYVNYNYASTIEWRKCKHVFPLKITILGFECEAIFMGANVKILHMKVKWSHLMILFGYLPPGKEWFAVMCNSLDASDVIVQNAGIL